MIPKIIHYVWVGGNPKPDIVLRCIESWKANLADYEIIEWNDEKIKGIDNLYMQEALYYKKWAFVSDYVRLWALYHYGGIYLDTDVEIKKRLDEFLYLDFFSGFEQYLDEHNISPITALMASTRQGDIVADLLKLYDERRFVIDGKIDITTNTSFISHYLCEKYGCKEPFDSSNILVLAEKKHIYPSGYFCIDTPDSYAVHHFSGSWIPSWYERFKIVILNYRIVIYKRHWMERETPPDILKDEKLIFAKAINLIFPKRRRILLALIKDNRRSK